MRYGPCVMGHGSWVNRHSIGRLLFPAFILLILFLSAGCAKKEASEANKDIELVMWLIGSEGQAITIRDVAEGYYNRAKVRVRCEAISWGDAHSKYLTSIAGGVAPDIGTMGLTWGTEFGDLDSMVNLSQAYPDDIAEIKDSIFPGLWNSVEHEGKVFGIPFDMTEYVLYYRSDMIPNPPQTWEQLTTLLGKLSQEGKGMIFDWGSLSWIGYSPFLWQAGGDFYNSDRTEVTVDSPEAIMAMRFFSGLYTKYDVPKTKIPLEQGMRTGDFPIAISGNWMIDSLRLSAPEIAGKWAIATLPKGPTGKFTAFIGGRIVGIFKQSKNQDAAWQFIKFLFTPEIESKLYEAALTEQDTYLPPSIKTWDILNMDPAFKDVLVRQAHDAKGPPPVGHWDSISRFVDEAIQRVILQSQDPAEALKQARASMERFGK